MTQFNHLNAAVIAEIFSNKPTQGHTMLEIYAHPRDAAVMRHHMQCVEENMLRIRMTYHIFEDNTRPLGLMLFEYNEAGK